MFFKYWFFNIFSKMNFVHSAWMECPLKLVLLTCLLGAIRAENCPPILVRTMEPTGAYECWPECQPGYYCHNGLCNVCRACPDPYTLAEQGETELDIIAECINKGFCPNACYADSWPTGNVTLCYCADVTPPPPTVPPTIACMVGCKHGGCVETGECNCDDGWSGALCDECVLDSECLHGRCNETERCMCTEGWDGDNCDQDVSYCGMNQPCLNSGLCENDGNGGFTCTCSEGFIGAICGNETSLHRCQRDCPMNGTCIETESAGEYKCHCQHGFAGAGCIQPIPRSPESYFFLGSIVLIIVLVIILIFAVFFIVLLLKKCGFNSKSEGIPGSSSNSGIPLIGFFRKSPRVSAIDYRLEGTTVFLGINPSWKPCFLKTCKCLMDAPLRISEDSRTEVSVPDLRNGFKYNFVISKCKTTPSDVEENDCSVAECEVSVESNASENGESNCAKTIGDALFNVATKKALNRPLEVSSHLRVRVACFFGMPTDHHKSFKGGQTLSNRHIDILQEVLESYDLLDKPIEELLSHLAEESCKKETEDFVEILTKFHPQCLRCARLWHQTHGGTLVLTHGACNDVAINV